MSGIRDKRQNEERLTFSGNHQKYILLTIDAPTIPRELFIVIYVGSLSSTREATNLMMEILYSKLGIPMKTKRIQTLDQFFVQRYFKDGGTGCMT